MEGALARQQFFEGGFIGKLGNVVGQRYHGKLLVRSYVVPENPQTPRQQANRSQFAHATKLAQLAYNWNKGAPEWKALPGSEFPNRVSTANRRLLAGADDMLSLPLFPDGVEVSRTLDFIGFMPVSLNYAQVYFTGDTLPIYTFTTNSIGWYIIPGVTSYFTFDYLNDDNSQNYIPINHDLTEWAGATAITIACSTYTQDQSSLRINFSRIQQAVTLIPAYSGPWIAGNIINVDPSYNIASFRFADPASSVQVPATVFWILKDQNDRALIWSSSTITDPRGDWSIDFASVYPGVQPGYKYQLWSCYQVDSSGQMAWSSLTGKLGAAAGPLFGGQ
jgi:hypothetical protein